LSHATGEAFWRQISGFASQKRKTPVVCKTKGVIVRGVSQGPVFVVDFLLVKIGFSTVLNLGLVPY
jgi:hypothetical protein